MVNPAAEGGVASSLSTVLPDALENEGVVAHGTAADVVGEADFRPGNLVADGPTQKLPHGQDRHGHPRCPYRMSLGLEAPGGVYRQPCPNFHPAFLDGLGTPARGR